MAKRYYNYEETHQTFNGVKHKRCTKCKKWKQESEFHKDRARRDGLRLYCKGCAQAYERKVRRKNRKAVREYLRYEDRHRVIRGFKEKLCTRCKQWKYESDFYRNRRSKDGLAHRCKDCRSARDRLEGEKTVARRNLRYEDRHRTVDGVKEKFCRKCGKWKAESEYYKHQSSRDGLDDRCKQCTYKPSNKSRGKGLGVKK